jgi:hypothetical protein
MTTSRHTPTDRELAELASALGSSDDSSTESLTVEEVMNILDDPYITAERQEYALRALNRDPALYQAWLAGRRRALKDRQQAREPDPAEVTVPPPPKPGRERPRKPGWWQRFGVAPHPWPWLAVGSAASLLFGMFLGVRQFAPELPIAPPSPDREPASVEPAPTGPAATGPPPTTQVPKQGDIRFVTPKEPPEAVERRASQDFDTGFRLGARAGDWYRVTVTACAASQGKSGSFDWESHAVRLGVLSRTVENVGVLLTGDSPLVVRLAEGVSLELERAGPKTDRVALIQSYLCDPARLDTIKGQTSR